MWKYINRKARVISEQKNNLILEKSERGIG
jgi:hypothetical protein